MILEHLIKALRHRTDRRLLFKTKHTPTPESLEVWAVFVLTMDDTGEYQFGDCVVVTDNKWWEQHRESVLSKHVVLYDSLDPEDKRLSPPVKAKGKA